MRERAVVFAPMALGLVLAALAAATRAYGYWRGRWRALAEVVAAAVLGLAAGAALLALGVWAIPEADGRALAPGTLLFLSLPAALPLVALGVLAGQSK